MASQIKAAGLEQLMEAWIAAETIKCTLLMTNTTADTEEDAATVSAFSTLDEMDGSGFTWGHGNTGRKTLTITPTHDTTNNRAEFTVSGGSTTWASLGAGTRSVQGALIFSEGTSDDTDAYPIAWVEFSSPFTANGTDFTINWDSEGVFHIT